MEKQTFKRKITLAVATIFSAMSVALAGCSTYTPPTTSTGSDPLNASSALVFVPKGSYIVLEEDGVRTLHKGYAYREYHSNSSNSILATDPTFEFECGETVTTNEKYSAYHNSKPDESKYDHVCECAEAE